MTKRIINIRVMTSVVIGLIAGILVGYSFSVDGIKTYKIVLFYSGLLLIGVGCITYAIFTRKNNLKFEHRKKISFLLICSTVGFVIANIMGFVMTYYKFDQLTYLEEFSQVAIKGVVSDYIEDNTTYKKFILDNCTVVTNEEVKNLDFKICVYTYNGAQVSIGDVLVFVGNLEKYNYNEKSGLSKLSQGIGYSTYLNFSKAVKYSGDLELKDVVKNKVRKLLDDNLNGDNARITYAILFGEKQGLNQDIKDVFSYAGISHILAVSGLHIGVLVATLIFIFKKLRVKGWLQLIILICVLGFYSYLCSFTPSVMRASIMALLLVICKIFLIEYDGISSLSIAGIIILCINPLSIFTISFQLSFLCVLSMIALAPTLARLLNKIKIPKLISNALAVSISTNLVILPVCANSFDTVSLMGVFTNLLVLPLFSVAYVLLFLCVILCLLLPFLSILFLLPSLFLHLIKVIADISTKINFCSFKIFNISYWVLFLILVTILTLHFLMINRKFKGVLVSILTIIIVTMFIGSSLPSTYNNSNILVYKQSDSNVVFYVDDNNVTLIGCNIQSYQLNKQMKHFKLSKIDNIIAYDLQLNDLGNLIDICKVCKVENLYIPDKLCFDSIINKFNNVVGYNEFGFNLNKMNFKPIDYKENTIAVLFEINNKSFLIPEISPNKSEIEFIHKKCSGDIDCLIIRDSEVKIDPQVLGLDFTIGLYEKTNGSPVMACLRDIISYRMEC